MLSGNVTPSDMPKYSDGRASGMAWLTTAGTAMYDALAANTISKVASPCDSPSAHGARGLARGSFYTREGVLVASTAQEGLIRLVEKEG